MAQSRKVRHKPGPALFVQDNCLSKGFHIGRIVRDDNCGDGQAAQRREQFLTELLAKHGVQRSKRLIQQKQTRLGKKCAGQGHPLALPTRKLGRECPFQSGQPQPCQQILRPLPLPCGDAPTATQPHKSHKTCKARTGIGHIVQYVQMREQGIILKHIAHVPLACRKAKPPGPVIKAVCPKPDKAGIRPAQSCQTVQCQALAGA